jgi:hypothetical protein
MRLLWVLLFGSVFALQPLLWAPGAEAVSHDKAKRAAECANGDTKVVSKIVSNTIKHAKGRFKLTDELVGAAEGTKRAETEMKHFLNWKLGSPSAVCAQYITAGQKHFDKGYSNEAAVALLGEPLPGTGSAKFKLSKKTSAKLKALIKDCANEIVAKAPAGAGPSTSAPARQSAASPASAGKSTDKLKAQAWEGLSERCKQQAQGLGQQLEQDQGIEAELKEMAVREVSTAAVNAVDRIGFEAGAFKKRHKGVSTSEVESLIAEKRDQSATR